MGSVKPNNVIPFDAYAEGQRAYHDGKTWHENPYAHMACSPHSYMWTCGWDDASLNPTVIPPKVQRVQQSRKVG